MRWAVKQAGLRPPPGREERTVGARFDLMASKLRQPEVRPETIRRSSLITRLARDDGRTVVSVVAPSGYGKTTLISQWAAQDGRAVAWVSLDERDNDPKVLLSYVAEALNAVQPLPAPVFEALASRVSSVPGSVVPRLASAFWSTSVPLLLVLDDVHLLSNAEGRDALSVLAGHVPTGSRLVLVGRAEPPLRTARLRAQGQLTEVGAADLSLNRAEAATLLRAAGVAVGEDDLAALHQRTEGWPAGLYLAALYLREGGSPDGAAASFGGDDQFVSEYMESEFLTRISRRHRMFLPRTAVLERMCGSLCEALLTEPGSAAVLTELAGSNLLLVPLDRRRTWYRYHHLFRDMLRAELERTEPGLVPVLLRRAGAWCLDQDRPEEALEYSIAAGDVEGAAQLIDRLALPAFRQARHATVGRWLRWLQDHDGIAGHPMAAVWASFIAAQLGQSADAERWAESADQAAADDAHGVGAPDAQAWATLLRALVCRDGAKQMLTDAEEAERQFAAAGIYAPIAGVCHGIALLLSGNAEGADAVLERAIGDGNVGAPDVLSVALCERTVLAIAAGDWDAAAAFAARADAR